MCCKPFQSSNPSLCCSSTGLHSTAVSGGHPCSCWSLPSSVRRQTHWQAPWDVSACGMVCCKPCKLHCALQPLPGLLQQCTVHLGQSSCCLHYAQLCKCFMCHMDSVQAAYYAARTAVFAGLTKHSRELEPVSNCCCLCALLQHLQEGT